MAHYVAVGEVEAGLEVDRAESSDPGDVERAIVREPRFPSYEPF
jgi:hypothetical protein